MGWLVVISAPITDLLWDYNSDSSAEIYVGWEGGEASNVLLFFTFPFDYHYVLKFNGKYSTVPRFRDAKPQPNEVQRLFFHLVVVKPHETSIR